MIELMEMVRLLMLVYLVIINIAGIIVCGIDKKKAKRHQWRIPERNIFMIAILGGSVGVLLGMYGFRHKTKHRQFTIGIPFILLCQIFIYLVVKAVIL